jgi:hypothetical protein
MNEEVFSRLHYQSGLVAQGCWDELDEYDRAAIVRFAELIVQECAGRVDWILAVGGGTQGDLIREHFGVK